jgi:uncharacterized protein (DUF1684 family)
VIGCPAAAVICHQLGDRERAGYAVLDITDIYFTRSAPDSATVPRPNGSTTYSGYRIVNAPSIADGKWTVLDFNLAANPPCAYSTLSTAPPRGCRCLSRPGISAFRASTGSMP